MLKKRILGVVVVPMMLAIPATYNIIINSEQAAAFVEEGVLEAAIERAKVAAELARENPSDVYPGLAEYVDGLVRDVETHDYVNMEVAVEALNDAAESIPLLLKSGKKPEQKVSSTLSRKSEAMAMNLEESELVSKDVKEEKPAVAVGNTSAKKVEAAESAPVQKTQVATMVKTEEKTAETVANTGVQLKVEVEDTPVELPKTGAPEENKISVAGLVAAGVTVVIATALASMVIIRAKRKK